MQLTPGQARYLSDRYDENVRRVDDALAKLFGALDALDLWKDTVVIVTSDHGEEFLEHGQVGHERTLSAEALAIPLLVAAPGIAPRVAEEVVGLADLVPTVLELTGRARDGRLDGRSLVPLLRGGPDAGRADWILSEVAWQVERVARTTRTGRDEIEPIAMVLDTHGLLKLRAGMLANGYKPRPVDPAQRADELRALGY
jgi:arylsulfatase A-like enzyme